MNSDEKRKLHAMLCEHIHETYKAKNTAYGDSFSHTVTKYGLVAALTRMSDKFGRVEALILGAENRIPDESLKDTLLDLADYALMTVMELEAGEEAQNMKPNKAIPPINLPLNEKLIKLRAYRGLSQAELAERIGIAQTSISNYERADREPSVQVLSAYAEFFEIDVSCLISNSQPTKPHEQHECLTCRGTGTATRTDAAGSREHVDCPVCNGKGWVWST